MFEHSSFNADFWPRFARTAQYVATVVAGASGAVAGLSADSSPPGVGGAGRLMPRWARRLYRLPGLATTDMGATLALWALRSAAMRVPERYRVGPLVLAARQRAAHQVLPTA